METKQDWSASRNQLSTDKQNYLNPFSILIFIIMAIWGAAIIENGAGPEFNRMIGWMGIIALLWCVYSMKCLTNTFFSLPFMFEAAFYILTLGQSLLYAINGKIYHELNLYLTDNAQDVNHAYIFTVLCLLALNYGMILCHNSRLRFTWGSCKTADTVRIDYTKMMQGVGQVIAIVSVAPFAVTWGKILAAYALSGYTNAYVDVSKTTSWGKLFQMVGDFFPFSLFMLMAAFRENRRKCNIVIAAVFALSVLNFSIGNRSEPIAYIMASIWFMRERAGTAQQKRRAAFLLLGGALLMALIVPIIGETRNTGELNLSTVINSFSGEGSFASAIEDTIVSMGWSAFPAIKTMQLIPGRFGYHYGESYFFAVLSVIPNVIGGTHISVQYAGLPLWLKNTLHMTFGPGYSAPAEAYYNFGWYGMLCMPVIGYLAYKMLANRKKDASALRMFVMLASFVVLFSFPRREMLTAVRNCAYCVGLPVLAVMVMHNFQKGKMK